VKGVILLSGGLDSATVAAWKIREGAVLHGLTFIYGQRHSLETERARKLAETLGILPHHLVPLPIELFRGSALTESDIRVPEDQEIGNTIPATYVPARNLVFLSMAVAYAESHDLDTIYIGANAIDFSGYPDCRPFFIDRMNEVAQAATRRGAEGKPIRIEAPLVTMSKADIVRKGVQLGLDFSLTTSCYNPGPEGAPCRRCDACRLRARGFQEAGIQDPLVLL